MIAINPFSQIAAFVSPIAMQVFVILMVIMVVAGTLFDMIHKKKC